MPALIEHVRAIASVIPVIGFYLQPSVGGRLLPYDFWRQFVEIENVVAIKIAPFNRYQTLDVVRALVDSGRDFTDCALYCRQLTTTSLLDLLTRFDFCGRSVRIVGGLLGHWAVWTSKAVEQSEHGARPQHLERPVPQRWLSLAVQITDANAAFSIPPIPFMAVYPAFQRFCAGKDCLQGRWCLDPQRGIIARPNGRNRQGVQVISSSAR